jgi:hypothetical protein
VIVVTRECRTERDVSGVVARRERGWSPGVSRVEERNVVGAIEDRVGVALAEGLRVEGRSPPDGARRVGARSRTPAGRSELVTRSRPVALAAGWKA